MNRYCTDCGLWPIHAALQDGEECWDCLVLRAGSHGLGMVGRVPQGHGIPRANPGERGVPGADPQGHWGLQAGQCPYDSGWVDRHLVPEWDAWSGAGESALCLGRVVQYGAAAERRTAPKNFARGWDACLRPAASACLTMSALPYPCQGRHEGAHQTCCCPGCCAMIPVGVRVGVQ